MQTLRYAFHLIRRECQRKYWIFLHLTVEFDHDCRSKWNLPRNQHLIPLDSLNKSIASRICLDKCTLCCRLPRCDQSLSMSCMIGFWFLGDNFLCDSTNYMGYSWILMRFIFLLLDRMPWIQFLIHHFQSFLLIGLSVNPKVCFLIFKILAGRRLIYKVKFLPGLRYSI